MCATLSSKAFSVCPILCLNSLISFWSSLLKFFALNINKFFCCSSSPFIIIFSISVVNFFHLFEFPLLLQIPVLFVALAVVLSVASDDASIASFLSMVLANSPNLLVVMFCLQDLKC